MFAKLFNASGVIPNADAKVGVPGEDGVLEVAVGVLEVVGVTAPPTLGTNAGVPTVSSNSSTVTRSTSCEITA